jgi:hypothetical protein
LTRSRSKTGEDYLEFENHGSAAAKLGFENQDGFWNLAS